MNETSIVEPPVQQVTQPPAAKSFVTGQPVEPQSAADLLYLQLHYVDIVAQITNAKQHAWAIVQWSATTIFGVVGLQALKDVSIPSLIVQLAVMAAAAGGLVLIWLAGAELGRQRVHLQHVRERMGGWVLEKYPSKRFRASKWIQMPIQASILVIIAIVASIFANYVGS